MKGTDRNVDDPRELVATACRVLQMEGQDHFLLGHVSVRAGTDRMWLKSFGKGLDEVTPDDVVLADLAGNPLEEEGGALPNEIHLHGGIYRHRLDVDAIVHTHPVLTSAFAASDAPFLMVSQDSLFFRGRLGRYPSARLVASMAEGDRLAAALGAGRLVVLRNHGLAAADRTLAGAVFLALAFERSLRVQHFAAGMGQVAVIPDAEAAQMAAEFEEGYASRVQSTWAYLVRRLQARGGFDDRDRSERLPRNDPAQPS